MGSDTKFTEEQYMNQYNKIVEQNKHLQSITRLFDDPYFKGFKPEQIILMAKSSLSAQSANVEMVDAIVKIQELLEVSGVNDGEPLSYNKCLEIEKAAKDAIEICKKHNPYAEIDG
jgi:hypothetical protein